ncbi:MAG: oligoendopeptidase F [Clostridia bacterium]|nr:oligoendopeptidase F [Clostridia bacterium]
MNNEILNRNEIPEEYTWRLSDLFESDDLWENALAEGAKLSDRLCEFKGVIKDKETLLNALELSMEISEKLLRIYAFAKMHRDEDNSVGKYQAMTDRAMRTMTEVSSKEAFLEPEIIAIGKDKVMNWVSECEKLSLYEHYLENLFRESEHVLSPKEEAILAHTSEIGDAAGEIFEMWNHADLKFDSIVDENGNDIEVTHGRYAALLQSHDRRVRCDAFSAVYREYKKWENTLAATLSSNVKKTCYFANVRKYNSAIEMALGVDNISVDVYDNLISTIRKGLPALDEYLKLRKRVLDVDEVHLYDVYVPIVETDERKYTFEEARDLVLNAVKPLGEQYVSDMKRAFEDRWVDVYENRGKTSGAYSWGSNDVHPYVLLNFDGTLSDVFTLAHEMGHAMHSYYTNRNQPPIYKNYKIFVAEVASTVNENLLMEYLLKNTDDKKFRAYLIGHRLEEFRTTVFRQTMFAEFEKTIHAAYENGESLTAEYLSDVYYKLNCDYMGGGARIDEEIAMEWARIPHFYSDFYVYQYATGYSAAVSLVDRILNTDNGVDRYLEFLKSGDSDYPLNLLATAGADLRTQEPILMALNVFKNDLNELKGLL